MNCTHYIIHSFIDHLSSVVFSVHGLSRGVSSTLAKMPKQATVAAKAMWVDHELTGIIIDLLPQIYWGLMVWWLYMYVYLFHELGIQFYPSSVV